MLSNASKIIGFIMLSLGTLMPCNEVSATVFASKIIAYEPGLLSHPGNPEAALGQPDPVAGAGTQFASIISPFSPHFEAGQIVQFGEGGSITLQLANFALTTPGTPEIGIFTNAGISDTSWPGGIAGTDLELPGATFGIDSAVLEVSADGVNWVSLGLTRFDQPSNAFINATSAYQSDPAGLTAADFGQPHDNTLADYAGKNWDTIKGLLGNSAGGTWIDLDATGLTQAGWVRLSLADDGDPDTLLNFELDAVSVATTAIGGSVIPEPPASVFLFTLLGLITRRCR